MSFHEFSYDPTQGDDAYGDYSGIGNQTEPPPFGYEYYDSYSGNYRPIAGFGSQSVDLGSVIGGALGFGASAYSAEAAITASKKDRAFQERMAKTKYQYTMADMKAAGLNPILAYQQGAGGIPSGSTAKIPDFAAGMARGAEAGKGASLAAEQKRLLQEQQNSARAAANAANAQAALTGTKNQHSQLELPKSKVESSIWDSFVGLPAKLIGMGTSSAKKAARAYGALKQSSRKRPAIDHFRPTRNRYNHLPKNSNLRPKTGPDRRRPGALERDLNTYRR